MEQELDSFKDMQPVQDNKVGHEEGDLPESVLPEVNQDFYNMRVLTTDEVLHADARKTLEDVLEIDKLSRLFAKKIAEKFYV